MSKTKITNFNVNWLNIKNLCRNTVALQDSCIEPSKEWKRKILICKHSPIRAGEVQWKWTLPTYVSNHYARHVHSEKWVTSQRDDRSKDGIPRSQKSQTELVDMSILSNLDALSSMAEKRLCMCADKTTREYMFDLKEAIKEYDEDISWSLVPSCIRLGGCPEEFSNCKFYENFSNNLSRDQLIDIIGRYDAYERYLNGELENNNELMLLFDELIKDTAGGLETFESREKAKELVKKYKK